MNNACNEIGRGYWIAAHSYLSAIAKLVDHAQDDEAIVFSVLPINLLAGFCLELQFKAWLALKGWSDKRLKNELRHGLVKAFEGAHSEGLPFIIDLEKLVHILNEGHRDLNFRYLKAGVDISAWGDGQWAWGLHILRELDDEVQQFMKSLLEAE